MPQYFKILHICVTPQVATLLVKFILSIDWKPGTDNFNNRLLYIKNKYFIIQSVTIFKLLIFKNNVIFNINLRNICMRII